MSEAERSKIQKLQQEAERLPHGETQVGLLDEAVRVADSTQDLDVMFEARMKLICSAIFSGHAEKSMVAFPWCLTHFRREPARFARHKHNLLWYFKNVSQGIARSLQVPLDQFEGLLQQMAKMYRDSGYNLRPVCNLRMQFAVDTGDCTAAAHWFDQRQGESRDRMADCEACEADTVTQYYELIDDLEKCIEVSRPNLDGLRRCAEVPHRVLHYVLRPLAILGRYDEADHFQRRGYQLIRHNPEFITEVSMQLIYLVHRRRLAAAANMLERHLNWALSTYELHKRHLFYLGAGRVLCALAEGKTTRKLNLPREFPAFESSGVYDLQTLIAWFRQHETDLAAQFDRRNGNAFFSDALPERMAY